MALWMCEGVTELCGMETGSTNYLITELSQDSLIIGQFTVYFGRRWNPSRPDWEEAWAALPPRLKLLISCLIHMDTLNFAFFKESNVRFLSTCEHSLRPKTRDKRQETMLFYFLSNRLFSLTPDDQAQTQLHYCHSQQFVVRFLTAFGIPYNLKSVNAGIKIQ